MGMYQGWESKTSKNPETAFLRPVRDNSCISVHNALTSIPRQSFGIHNAPYILSCDFVRDLT